MFFFTKDSDIFFKPGSIEHAYFAILNDDLDTAQTVFENIDSPRAKWGKVFVSILKGYIEIYPTYFEIRKFLEIDLDFLIKNEKMSYIELILGSCEILTEINQETYKYIARVMLENKLYKAAKSYLDKSKDIFYNDPELHFLFAKYYIKMKDCEQADFHLDECLNILPDYYPARRLQKELSRYLA